MSYATLAEVKAWLGIDTVNLTDDTQITRAITASQQIIDTHCRRSFEAAADSVRLFDALGDHIEYDELWFDTDCCQITTIINGDSTTVTAGQYVTLPGNFAPYYGVRLKTSAGVSWTYDTDYAKAISVTGRWAYSVTAPADIVYACTRLAAYLYKQRDNYNIGLERAEATPMGTMLLPMALPKDVLTLLNPYVRR